MKRSQVWKQLLSGSIPFIILALGAAGLYGLVRKRPQTAEAPPEPQPPLVQTVDITSHTGQVDLQVDGLVVPFREMEVTAEVGGRIADKAEASRAGRFVSRDEVLYQIDRRDYELEVKRLDAQLDQAQASLEQLAVEIANAERLIKLAEEDQRLAVKEVQRLQSLSGGQYVSDSELDRAKKSELAARNALTMLSNQLDLAHVRRTGLLSARTLAETQLAKAQLDLRRTEVRAPIEGMILRDWLEQNAYVQPGAVLATIEDTSAVEVACSLRMEELSWLWRTKQGGENNRSATANLHEIPQTPVTIQYQYTDRPDVTYRWRGELSRYDGVGLDEQTRMVPCRVLVDDPGAVTIHSRAERLNAPPPPKLMRGMYVTVSIHIRPDALLVRVPEAGLRPGNSVWVSRRNRLRIIQPVHLVERIHDEQSEIAYWLVDAESSGLRAGDRLIVSPMVVVNDEMPIREQSHEPPYEPKQDEANYQMGDS